MSIFTTLREHYIPIIAVCINALMSLVLIALLYSTDPLKAAFLKRTMRRLTKDLSKTIYPQE
ncbi:hypothetical protein I4U23_000231 [Adineta vaga]|nr:hypothetical protein I4U23_000231 [Adineta vaga]